MGMQIKMDHKFTPEERKFLEDRLQFDKIAENDEREFPKKPARQKEPKPKIDKDIYDFVMSLDLQGLQSELRKLNVPPQGDEPELRAKLAYLMQDEVDAQK